MKFLPLESPDILSENRPCCFWHHCCCCVPLVGVFAVAGSQLLWAVDGTLQVLLASLLVLPPCCFRRLWFPTIVGVPAVTDSLLSGVPVIAGSLLFLTLCCCWLVHGCFWCPCCCWFPTAVGFSAVAASLLLTSLIFPSVLQITASKQNFASISLLHETKFRASFSSSE